MKSLDEINNHFLSAPPAEGSYWLSRSVPLPLTEHRLLDMRANGLTNPLDNSSAKLTSGINPLDAYHRAKKAKPDMVFYPEHSLGSPVVDTIEGMVMSKSSIEHSYMLDTLKDWIKPDDVVVEIGGGYGGLARLMIDNLPFQKLYLFDIPHSCVLQAYYIQETTGVEVELGLGGQGKVHVASWQDFYYLGHSNMIINTRSFMEMPQDTVGWYLNIIRQQAHSKIYSINRHKISSPDLHLYPGIILMIDNPWPLDHHMSFRERIYEVRGR